MVVFFFTVQSNYSDTFNISHNIIVYSLQYREW